MSAASPSLQSPHAKTWESRVLGKQFDFVTDTSLKTEGGHYGLQRLIGYGFLKGSKVTIRGKKNVTDFSLIRTAVFLL